jgi:hypothetical protein
MESGFRKDGRETDTLKRELQTPNFHGSVSRVYASLSESPAIFDSPKPAYCAPAARLSPFPFRVLREKQSRSQMREINHLRRNIRRKPTIPLRLCASAALRLPAVTFSRLNDVTPD